MISSLYCVGFPFDPTANVYFDELPSKIKLTGIEKKALRGKQGSLTKEAFIDVIYKNFMLHKTSFTDEDQTRFLDYYNGPMDEYKERLALQYDIVKAKGNNYVDRLLKSYLIPYLKRIDEYYKESNTTLRTKWQVVAESIPTNTVSLDDLTDRERNLCVLMSMSLTSYNQIDLFNKKTKDADFFIFAIIATKEKNIVEAVRQLWCLCMEFCTFDPFVLFYGAYPDLFVEKDFPFLHFAQLDYIAEQLAMCEEGGVTITEVLRLEDTNKAVFNSLAVNSLDDLNSGLSDMITSLEPNAKAPVFDISTPKNPFVDANTDSLITEAMLYLNISLRIFKKDHIPSMYTLAALGQVYINRVTAHLQDAFLDYELDNVATKILIVDKKGFFLQDKAYEYLYDIFLECKELTSQIESLASSSKSTEPLLIIKRLTDEAKKLGVDALNNLVRLNEISETITLKESEHIDNLSKIKKTIDAPVNSLISCIAKYNDNIITTENKVDLALELNDEAIKKELADEKLLVKELRNTIFNLQNTSIPLEASLPPELPISVIAPLLQKPDVFTVVEFVTNYHQTIVLSKKARASIKSNCEFERLDILLEKLSILASPAFINAYSEKGSGGCFAFLTKKELSFQESSMVNNRKNARDFIFDDGKTRDCKAHIRFGTNNKAQHQLRIYFKIEDDKLYIGEIHRHLETARKL